MITSSGLVFDLAHPAPGDVHIDDIVTHLARIRRFNGATRRPYCVAEHSLLVAEICERELAIHSPHALMAALLHDAHEAYLGDITAPVKLLAGEALAALEGRLERVVQQRYGIQTAATAWHQAIRRADLIALATERRDLLPDHPQRWAVLTGIEPVQWIDLMERDGMDEDDWAIAFQHRFEQLQAGRDALLQAIGTGAGQPPQPQQQQPADRGAQP